MSQPLVTLELPEDVYQRVRSAAKGMKQPVEQALVAIVRAALPSLEKVPFQYRARLRAMEDLSDAELRRVARQRLASAKQKRLARLLNSNQRTALTDKQLQVMADLRQQADAVMLERAYAAALLKYRGHSVSSHAEIDP